MTEFTYPDAASLPPRAFASHNTSTSQPLVPIVDPNLLSPSNGDCIGLDSKAASGPKPQSNSTWQVPQYHTLTHTHHMGAHNQHIPQATTSNRSILPRPHSTRSDRSGNNGQTVRPSLQSQQRRPNSDTGTQADATQGQPPRKKQRKSPASGNTLSKNATTEEAQETSEVAESDEDSGDTVDRSNYRARRVRMTNGVMKWLDEEDNRWSKSRHRAVIVELRH